MDFFLLEGEVLDRGQHKEGPSGSISSWSKERMKDSDSTEVDGSAFMDSRRMMISCSVFLSTAEACKSAMSSGSTTVSHC